MKFITKYIDEPIERFFSKRRHQYDRKRTQLEILDYWEAAVRNITPVTMEEHKSGEYIIINKQTLAKTIIGGVPSESENGYPEEMDDTMINKLIELSAKGCRIAYSLKLTPISSEKARSDIQQAIYITQINAEDTMAKVEKNKNISIQDMDSTIAQKHNTSNYQDVVENKHKTLDSSFIITMWAKNKDKLDEIQSDITLILESSGVKYEVPDYNHMEIYLSAQPFNSDITKTKVRILSPYGAMLASTRSINSQTDTNGMWFGDDRLTGKNIIFDVNKIIAPHALILGATGSGKTAAVLAYLMRLFGRGYQIVFITPKQDPGTNHRAIIDHYGPDLAALIDIGPKGNNINPLEIIYDRNVLGEDIDEYSYAYNMHKEIFIRFMTTWFDDTGSPNMIGLLDSTLNKLYNNAGIFQKIPSSWHNANWPVMEDLLNLLEEKKRSRKLDIDERKTVNAILNKSVSFKRDGMLGYMNNPTTVDFSKRMLFFDMSNIPPMIKPSMNLLVTAICGQRFSTNTKTRTVIAVDEAGVFLTNQDLTEFLLNGIRLGRSAGVSIWALTQQFTDLTKANVAEEFITNAFIKLILGNNTLPENIQIVEEHFKLSDFIVEQLLTSTVGDGVLIVNKQQIPIHIQLTQLELDRMNDINNPNSPHHVCTTEPILPPKLKELIMTNGFCLDSWATNFNIMGWKKDRVQQAIMGTGLITAWIKEDLINVNGTILNQSIDHYSTVIQIAAYILEKGITDVKVNHHTDADVVFTIQDDNNASMTNAIEFEIEGSHTEDQLQKKRHNLQEKYDNVYFVCHARYEKKLISYLGSRYVFTRGTQLKNLLDSIIG